MKTCAFLLVFAGFLFSQDQIQNLEAKDQKLKEEVEDLKSTIANFVQDKNDLLYQLKASDYNIRLSNKVILGIETRLKKLSIFIDTNRKKIKKIQGEQKGIKKQFADRLVSSYKNPPITLIDMLYNAKSVDQLMRHMKYKEILDEEEERLITRLEIKQRQLESAQKDLNRDLVRQKNEESAQKANLEKLRKEQDEQKKLMSSIAKSITKTQKAIDEKEKSRKETRRLIANLSKASAKTAANYNLSKTFSKNKGKFSWPVSGKVVRRFGKIKHSKYNIYEQNDGIDIASSKGSIVNNIHEGVVTNVFYQLGSGNTVIIDHGYGYFTVFAHLDDIVVKNNQLVQANEPIGTVGNSGTLDGKSKLHFEIWVNNQPINPVKWLR
jgi:septal ring factor EnvC (AmiA/AmiB activator)